MKKKASIKKKAANRIKPVVKSSKKLRAMESGNLISDLTGGKVTAIPFGGDVPEIGFDVKKWNECYSENRPEETKRLERYYRDKTNEARKANGLPPI